MVVVVVFVVVVVVGAVAVAACEWIINAFIVYLVVITIWISPWL